MEKYSLKEVHINLGDTLDDVSTEFKGILTKALTKIPAEVVDWTEKNIRFFSSLDSDDNPPCVAFFVNLKDWKHLKGFVFLCEVLKTKTEAEQAFWIAHEIAHAKLNQRNRVRCDPSQEKEIHGQEKEADKLAEEWLKS